MCVYEFSLFVTIHIGRSRHCNAVFFLFNVLCRFTIIMLCIACIARACAQLKIYSIRRSRKRQPRKRTRIALRKTRIYLIARSATVARARRSVRPHLATCRASMIDWPLIPPQLPAFYYISEPRAQPLMMCANFSPPFNYSLFSVCNVITH